MVISNELKSHTNHSDAVKPALNKDESNTSGADLTSLSPSLKSLVANHVRDTAPTPNFGYRHSCTIREEHGRSIFGVAFNSVNRSQSTDPLLFATVAGHYITVYQCHLKSEADDSSSSSAASTSSSISLLQSFIDPAGENEEFYCCAWSRDTSGGNPHPKASDGSWWWAEGCENSRISCHGQTQPIYSSPGFKLPPHQQLIAAAGRRGVIRIVCPSMASCPTSLVGHGAAINELKFHPDNPALLFSFSKDYTVRLWNIATRVLVCIFGGTEGHRAEVLHGDLSLTGELLLTAGMDHCVKIWRLNTQELDNVIEASFAYSSRKNTKPFPVLIEHFPEFSSRDVHGNYVDCARWFGGLVISKSCENSVTLWKPGPLVDTAAPVGGNTGWLEVGGLRLPCRLQPTNGNSSGLDVLPMPGVPTEHRTSVVHQLKAPDCNLWYIRFDIDLENQVLALGTGTGPARIYLWDLSAPESALTLPAQTLPIPGLSGMGHSGILLSHSAIRQTRFANEGKTLICIGDNGLVVRFDKIK